MSQQLTDKQTDRISPRENKKSLEALACSGAFDCFEGTHRAQYLAEDESLGSACFISVASSGVYTSLQRTLELGM